MDYYLLGKKKKPKGPYELTQLQELWKAGKIPEGTLCCEKGGKTWKPIGQFEGITKDTTSGSDVFAGCLVLACLAAVVIFAFVWGWSFWTYVGLAIAAVIAQVVIELVYDNVLGNKTKKNVPWFLHLPFGAAILLLIGGLLYLPYSLIFGPSADPLKGIYSYKFGSGSAFAYKFKEDGSATFVIIYQGSPIARSQWTQERRGSTVTLNAKNPDKVKIKKFEMTIQENGNLKRVKAKGKVEIYVKEGD